MAQQESRPKVNTTVSVQFREGVDASVLHTTLDALLEGLRHHTGCPACGLNGIDLILRMGDPIQESVAGVARASEAILGVSTTQGRATTI